MLTAPLQQQTAALLAAATPHPTAPSLGGVRVNFAYFMEPGTGKTWTVFAEFERLFCEDRVDVLVVVAPNGVHRAWLEVELPKHFGWPQSRLFLWSAAATRKRREAFAALLMPFTTRVPRIAAFNCEAFSHTQSEAERHLKDILRHFRVYLVHDESQTLKTPSAKRSQNLARLGRQATYRRLATGTHIAESPLDAYAQLRALDKALLGFDNYAVFKAHFAVWYQRVRRLPGGGEQKWEAIARWQHLDELKALIDQHAYLVRKQDCLDLPPKTYCVRYVELSAETRVLYRAALRQAIVEMEDQQRLTMRFAFTKMLRLAQITGGFVMPDGATEPQPFGPTNAKIDSLLALLQEIPPEEKVIVWARFRHEVDAVARAVRNAVRIHGGVPPRVRAETLNRFMQEPECRVLTGTTAVGGRGFNLTCATHVVYFSNNFSLEQRIQSEDRVHRHGQTRPVTYHDLTVPGTVDELALRQVQEKRTLADLFKGSATALRDWLAAQEAEL